MGWTDERVSSLKKLWLDGLSASQIAKQLGGGISRNSVISKVHRLGLSGRATPSQPLRPPVCKAPRPLRPTEASVPKKSKSLPPPPAESVSGKNVSDPPIVHSVNALSSAEQVSSETGSATILTLGSHMCKWPIGDPASDAFSYCGRAVHGDVPYCARHAQVAYQPPAVRRPRAGGDQLARQLRRYF